MNKSWDDNLLLDDCNQFNNSMLNKSTQLLLNYHPKKNGAIAIIAPSDIFEK